MTEAILKSRKTKEKLFSKKLRDPTFTDLDIFKEYNRIYAKICRLSKIIYYRDKFKEAEGNIRNTWNILREALNTL